MQKAYESSFDEGFYDYHGIGELTCPNGWTPAWLEGTEQGILYRPEYDVKDREKGQPEVRMGRYAANFFTSYATHDACLYRKFRVGAGNGVRASVWCMNVTHDKRGRPGGHGMRIGIDPTGGIDHTAPTVIYGDYWSSYMEGWKERKWKQVDTEAVAQADEITVFLHARCDYKAEINASHWDDLELQVGAPDEIEPPEQAAFKLESMSLEQLKNLVRQIVQDELGKSQ